MLTLSPPPLSRTHLHKLLFALLPIVAAGQFEDDGEEEEEEGRDWSLILGLVVAIVALAIMIICLVVVICEIRTSKPEPQPKKPQVQLTDIGVQTDPPEPPPVVPELHLTASTPPPSTIPPILFGRDLDGLYTLKERFAQGRFQKVIYASPIGSQREVALKIFDELERCQHEYHLYSTLMDPETSRMRKDALFAIPELLDAGTITIEDRQYPALVFEAAQISLKDYVIPKRVSEQYVVMSERSMFYQICNSLKFVHHSGYVHGDIHVGSVMFFTSRWKLIDFSNWGNSEVDVYHRSTPYYSAPEIVRAASNDLERIPSSQAADIWSLGLVGWELLTKKPLLPPTEYCPCGIVSDAVRHSGDACRYTEEDITHMSFGDIPFPWEGKPAQFWSAIKSPSAVKLIQNCIRRDPEQRWNIDKIIQYMKFWS